MATWFINFAAVLPWCAGALALAVLCGRKRFTGFRLLGAGLACIAGAAGVLLAVRYAEREQSDAVIWLSAIATAALILLIVYDVPDHALWPAKRTRKLGPFRRGDEVTVDGRSGTGRVVGGRFDRKTWAWIIDVCIAPDVILEMPLRMVHAAQPPAQPAPAPAPAQPAPRASTWAAQTQTPIPVPVRGYRPRRRPPLR